jgi:phosphoesterase RecJ-like protein
MLQQVLNTIDKHSTFLATSHTRPDGDAIGSLLGTRAVLRALGKRVETMMSDPVPIIYRTLPDASSIRQEKTVNGRFEAAILLECDSVARSGISGLESGSSVLVNIDHHTSGKPFAHVNWIDPHACATAEMIYQLAKAAKVKITPEMATCLYTAVLTDTGAFCFEGTDRHTFELAEELVAAGADPAAIAQRVYFANPESKMRLLGSALSTLQRSGDLAWMHVTQRQMMQVQAREEDCEGLVNYAVGIAGVEVALFFRELPGGRYRVSLRSKGSVDVSKIAATFGGGGHECAGGCSIAGPLEVAVENIMSAVSSQSRAERHQ